MGDDLNAAGLKGVESCLLRAEVAHGPECGSAVRRCALAGGGLVEVSVLKGVVL